MQLDMTVWAVQHWGAEANSGSLRSGQGSRIEIRVDDIRVDDIRVDDIRVETMAGNPTMTDEEPIAQARGVEKYYIQPDGRRIEVVAPLDLVIYAGKVIA